MPNTVKNIIRRYGVRITWLHASGSSTDLDTGEKNDTVTPRSIRKALILTEIITEKFTYDLSYIAANKNFIEGGFYAQGKRTIAILKTSLSAYTMNDRVKINGVTYRIHQAFDNPNGVWGFNLTDIKNVN